MKNILIVTVDVPLAKERKEEIEQELKKVFYVDGVVIIQGIFQVI